MYSAKLLARTPRVKQRKGFTLVELIVVVLIIGILASIAIVGYSSFTGKSRTTAATVNLQTFAKAILAEHTSEAKHQLSRDVVLQALSSSNPAVTDGVNAADNAVLLGKDGTPSSDKEYAIGFTNEPGGAVNDEGGYHAILTTFADDQIIARSISYGGKAPITLPSETFGPSTSPEDIFDGIEAPEPDPEPELPTLTLAYAGTTNVDPLTQTSFLPSVSGVQGTPQFSYDLVDGDLPEGFSFSASSGEITLDVSGEVITQISASSNHAAAVTSSGKVYTWGKGGLGRLGHGDTTDRNTPTLVTGVSDVTQIAATLDHTVALTSDGDVYTWGSGQRGALGHGDTSPKRTPTRVTALSDVTLIGAGDSQSAAVTSDGVLYTWGESAYNYPAALPGYPIRDVPTQVTGISNVTQVGFGAGYTAALDSNDDLYIWGIDSYDYLGLDATKPTYTTPTRVAGISAVTQFSASQDHIAAVTNNGHVYTWGLGSYGRLGHGDSTQRYEPTRVTGLPNVSQVATGRSTTFAITNNGDLYAWGRNTNGQLGLGETGDKDSPTRVTALSGVDQIVAGENLSVALTSSGDLYTWGSSDLLGLGNITGIRETPQPVSLLLDTPSWDFTLDVTVADSANRTTTTTSRFNTLP